MKTIFVTLLAFTLLLLSCIKDEKEDVINYIEENDKLPEFTVKSATGEELHSEDLSGKHNPCWFSSLPPVAIASGNSRRLTACGMN